MQLFKLSLVLLYANFVQGIVTKIVLIIPHGMGYNDLEDLPNANVIKYLPNTIADFTVAAADTIPSYKAILTGKLQLDLSPNLTLSDRNLHSNFKLAGVATGHFGWYSFNNTLGINEVAISSDPVLVLSRALAFARNHDNYFMTVFMPFVDVMFSDLVAPLANLPGVSNRDNPCRDTIWKKSDPVRYKICPRQIARGSLRYADTLLEPLLKELTLQKSFVIWNAVHGGIDPHTHANSSPRSALRGGQYSLYDGGIRTRFRYNSGIYPKFAQNAGNAIDLFSSLTALANIGYQQTDGINLFESNTQRSIPLQWITLRRSEGNCKNTSPARAIKVEQNNKEFMLLYDSKRTEIYDWNSGYQLEYADQKFTVPTRPINTLTGCELAPATGLNINKTSNEKPEGIIFIMTDDIGHDFSFISGHAKGNNYPNTPNIDAMRASGALFMQYYTSGTVCSPTRAAFLTGRDPNHADVGMAGVYKDDIKYISGEGIPPYLGAKKNISYIARFFQQKGWATGQFGKFHEMSAGNSITPSYYGFDEYKCHSCNAARGKKYNSHDLYYPAYASGLIVGDALNWMEQQIAANKSFFLYIALQSAHAPLNTWPGQVATLGYADLNNSFIVPGLPRTVVHERPLQVYNGLIAEQDKQIGVLVSRIDNLKKQEKVAIFYTSDNGPEWPSVYFNSVGDPGPHRGGKRSNYEGGINVPLIVKWGTKITGSSNLLLSTSDFYPTLVSLAGFKISEAHDYARLDGRDLTACVFTNDCSAVNGRSLFWESRWSTLGADCLGIAPRYAVRSGDLKLLLESPRRQSPKHDYFTRVELYNVTRDPIESQNLATQYPELVELFTQRLRSRANRDYDSKNTDIYPHDMGTRTLTYKSSKMRVGLRC